MDDVMELLARTDPVTRDPAWPTSDDGRRVMEAAVRTEPGVDPDAPEPSRRQRVAFYTAAAAAVVVLALAAVALVGADDRADTASEGGDGGTYAPGAPWVERVPDPPPGFELIDRGIASVFVVGEGEQPPRDAPEGHSFEFRDGDRTVALLLSSPAVDSDRGPQSGSYDERPGSPNEEPRIVDVAGIRITILDLGAWRRAVAWEAADGSAAATFTGSVSALDEEFVLHVLGSLGVHVER